MAIVVVLAGSYLGYQRLSDSGCTGSVRLTVAAANEIAPAVEQAAQRWIQSGANVNGTCVAVSVTPVNSATMAAAIAGEHKVTLTGLGDRVHLASPDIGLGTHIADVVNTIEFEKLNDVVLVGHSYGGMVITGVAERIPQRIRHLVYVDAFLPENGESVQKLADRGFDAMVSNMSRNGMMVPPWAADSMPRPKDVPHPLKTFTDTVLVMAL